MMIAHSNLNPNTGNTFSSRTPLPLFVNTTFGTNHSSRQHQQQHQMRHHRTQSQQQQSQQLQHTTFGHQRTPSQQSYELMAIDTQIDSDTVASSPQSAHSFYSRYTGSIPNTPVNTASLRRRSNFNAVVPSTNSGTSLSQVPDLMPSGSWISLGQGQGQAQAQSSTTISARHNTVPPRGAGRLGHQRDSSISSMGSNGPVSPFPSNLTTPQIAVTDETFHDLGSGDVQQYTHNLSGKPLADMADNFSTHLQSLASQAMNTGTHHQSIRIQNQQNQAADQLQQQHTQPIKLERGLLPAPELSIGSGSRRTRSVASSTAGGDSPVTPSLHEMEDEKCVRKGGKIPEHMTTITSTTSSSFDEIHQPLYLDLDPGLDLGLDLDPCLPYLSAITSYDINNITTANTNNNSNNNDNSFPTIPKLNRTMTDMCNDELYHPNFITTSASPPQSTLPISSPSNDRFAKVLQRANDQHLNASQSPATIESMGGHSPFRHRSLSSIGQHDQDFDMGTDAESHAESSDSPKTMSPKDAMLEFPDVDNDDDAFSSMFPENFDKLTDVDAHVMGVDSARHSLPQQPHSQLQQQSATSALHNAFNFELPTNIQMMSQYSVEPRQRLPLMSSRKQETDQSMNSVFLDDGLITRPADTTAAGGTYTCTYHGCTQRFDTPALLQRHKREGHRQANTTSSHPVIPSPVSLPGGVLFNTQAGPHHCNRINPSTGKSCDARFSRPYDLTRHEDTIHNMRKQKVRCHLCTEDKLFSRADALTRHFRVCHPEVQHGKHRRRTKTATQTAT